MSKKYLYGASVQGIQQFIFQTNELQDIVGASELVDSICKEMFKEFAHGGEFIQKAAGNIRFLFEDQNTCRKAVKEFPKKVLNTAPGISITQAVVCIEDGSDFRIVKEELEKRLHFQRNCPMRSMTIGLMGMERSRKTGLPVVKEEKGEMLDAPTVAKRAKTNTRKLCEKSFGAEEIKDHAVAYNIEGMTSKNDWIAIIHADGNGLGKVVEKVSKDGEDKLKEFSSNLDKATEKAAQETYKTILSLPEYEARTQKIPFRPVVLGGDDMTIICRADLAVPYTKAFLVNFEKYTSEYIGSKLTACAGIAFIKSSYPFYYGYDLAETLCTQAKNTAKKIKEDLAPSCLMFHKVQSSFVEDYAEIKEKELTPNRDYKTSYAFGPYFLEDQSGYWTVKELQDNVRKLEGDLGNKAKGHIRQWMTLMNENYDKAQQKEERVKSVGDKYVKEIFEKATKQNEKGEITYYAAYDLLALHSVTYQEIKNNEEKGEER